MLGKIGSPPNAAGSAYTVSNGLNTGTITERPTPGQGLYTNGNVKVWANGAATSYASGTNLATAPAAPSTAGYRRIDIWNTDNTWTSGASSSTASGVTFPTPTKTWVIAVYRVSTDANVIRNLYNGTNAFIYGWNMTTAQLFDMNLIGNRTVNGSSYLWFMTLPFYNAYGGVAEITWNDASFCGGSTSGSRYKFEWDGVSYGIEETQRELALWAYYGAASVPLCVMGQAKFPAPVGHHTVTMRMRCDDAADGITFNPYRFRVRIAK